MNLRIHGAVHGKLGILPSFPWLLVASGLQAIACVLRGEEDLKEQSDAELEHKVSCRCTDGINHLYLLVKSNT